MSLLALLAAALAAEPAAACSESGLVVALTPSAVLSVDGTGAVFLPVWPEATESSAPSCSDAACQKLELDPRVQRAWLLDDRIVTVSARGALWRSSTGEAEVLEPVAVCSGKQHATLLYASSGALQVVDASGSARALDDEAVIAMAWRAQPPSPEGAKELLALGSQSALDAAIADPRADIRELAAGFVTVEGAAGAARLWLLAHDDVAAIRWASLDAARRACESSAACVLLMRLFFGDRMRQIAWSARDELLLSAPEAAFGGAPLAYKLDAIALLTAELQRFGLEAVEPALAVLMVDPHPEVREAAALLRSSYP